MTTNSFNKSGILLVLGLLGLFSPASLFCQAERLGIVTYVPPKGMTKSAKENVVAFSEFNQAANTYCIITVYGATPGTGKPASDFKREWDNLVVKIMKAELNPKTDTALAEGWTVISGGSEVESDAGKGAAFLTVISGLGKTVSILAVFNDPAYIKQIDAFIRAIDLDKAEATQSKPGAAPTFDSFGRLIIPPLTFQLTVSDIVGEWGEDAQRISTTYVDRSTGAYRGTDNLTFRSKMTFTSGGGYLNDFFAIRNGQKIIDKTSGTVSITGRVLSIKQKNTAKYVLRGWLELPDVTIMKMCGPWFDNDVIPAEIFSNPAQGANLDQIWVRKK